MDPLVWAVLLLVLGLTLVCLEVFVPSGGILGFLSIASLVAGVVLAFYHRGIEVGLIFTVVTLVAVPTALATAFRYWPKTPMGRRLLLDVPTADEVLPDGRQRMRQLVGKYGVAKSVMMPSGAVLIDGQTIDALSEGISIEPGQAVKIIEVRGGRVLVRPVDKTEEPLEKDDVLSQPIESIGLDSFDDPLV